jgi:hypothetical protein
VASFGVAVGFLMGLGACLVWLGALTGAGCGGNVPPLSTALVNCQLRALSTLPTEPLSTTPADVLGAVGRLRACLAPPPDAGR